MFSRSVKKSAAGAIAVGAVLGLTQLSAPVVTTASPSIHNMACGGYQSGVATDTNVRLRDNVIRYPNRGVAVTTVKTATGTVHGKIRIRVIGEYFTIQTLHDGRDVTTLRRLKGGHTYQVKVVFPAQGCYNRSEDSAFLTVKRHR